MIGAVRPACRPRCPTGRFEDERLSSCVDELMRLYRAVWRAGVSSHARRPPGCGGDLAWLSRGRGVDYDLSSLFVFMQQQPNQH